jgi:hypothetical protein
MSRAVVPLTQLARRIPEAGRIRMGVKTARAMTSINTLRFTSPDRGLIEQIARLYGGDVKPWNEPKAANTHQFEVIVTAEHIPVFVVPDGLSINYELWAGGGCVRRCDGEICEVQRKTPDGGELVDVACICVAERVMECRPYTRMQLVLPEISFAGVWRLETKGWNAAHELPGMFDMIAQLQGTGRMVRALLSIEHRRQKVFGRTQDFVVPKLAIEQTALELQAGQADASAALSSGHAAPTAPALGSGGADRTFDFEFPEMNPADDDIVDAEVIDEAELDARERLAADARNFGLDPERFVSAVLAGIAADPNDTPTVDRMLTASSRMRAGTLVPLGFRADGRVDWQVPT